MKNLLVIIGCTFLMSFKPWEPDFERAKQTAKEKHELILLNFSGSDWCGPCIRMHKEIFQDPAFAAMAEENLVLVNADFPRNKKNQLSKSQSQQNDRLADKYNPSGKFPYTVLINTDGKILKAWDGLPDANAADFASQIKSVCDANR